MHYGFGEFEAQMREPVSGRLRKSTVNGGSGPQLPREMQDDDGAGGGAGAVATPGSRAGPATQRQVGSPAVTSKSLAVLPSYCG